MRYFKISYSWIIPVLFGVVPMSVLKKERFLIGEDYPLIEDLIKLFYTDEGKDYTKDYDPPSISGILEYKNKQDWEKEIKKYNHVPNLKKIITNDLKFIYHNMVNEYYLNIGRDRNLIIPQSCLEVRVYEDTYSPYKLRFLGLSITNPFRQKLKYSGQKLIRKIGLVGMELPEIKKLITDLILTA